MKKGRPLLYFLVFVFAFTISRTYVNACGCGIAIGSEQVFNALKESQAYLFVDVRVDNSYSQIPFFRFTSIDRNHDVKMVFPMKDIPTNVTADNLTKQDFFNKYGINDAVRLVDKQGSEKIKMLKQHSLISTTAFTQGAILLGYNLGYQTLGIQNKNIGIEKMMARSLVASFEFDGGKLDIYGLESNIKFDEFLATQGIEPSEKLQQLIEKYKDDYIAVLNINVKSAIPESEIMRIEQCNPMGIQKIRNELKQSATLTRYQIEKLTKESNTSITCTDQVGEIKTLTSNYINAILYKSDELEGIAVKMDFTDIDRVFYPISVVNSYEYPVAEQMYVIKTPLSKDLKFNSASPDELLTGPSERWYQINSTKYDLDAKIINASALVKMQDHFRLYLELLDENFAIFVGFLLALLLMIFPVFFYKKLSLSKRNLVFGLIALILFGFFFGSMYFALVKKIKVMFYYWFVWILLLVLVIPMIIEMNKTLD